jgi:carboxylesterase type B
MSLEPKQVLETLHSSLPDKLLKIYGLAKSQTTNVSSIRELMQPLIALETDELFAASIARLNREFSKTGTKVYSYHFDRGNPFPGPMNGIAHHALDLEYVFGNFLKGFTDKRDVDMSKALMKFWIGFANGKEPWADYTSGKALYLTPDAEVTVVPREQITSRRWAAFLEMDKIRLEVRKTGIMLTNGDLNLKTV